MSELGDVLELLHSAAGRYATLRATIREWHHLERSQRVWERHFEAMRARSGTAGIAFYGVSDESAPPPETMEAVIRFWNAANGKRRMERNAGLGDEHTVVSDGEHEWSYTPGLGAIVNPADSSSHGFEHLIDPSALLGQIDLEPVGRTSVAGRPAILVRATSRERAWEWHGPVRLPEAADSNELAVDAERGILLRTVSYVDGEAFVAYEMLEVVFDEAFPDDTFVFTPPPGEEISDAESAFPEQAPVAIEEAATLAPFTVLLPRRLPEGAGLHVLYFEGLDRMQTSPSVNLVYWFEGAGHSLSIAQTGESQELSSLPWENVERDDGTALRFCEQYGQRLLVCERHGTHIMMTSDLDRETLVEIALSLEPAPTEPPRLVDA